MAENDLTAPLFDNIHLYGDLSPGHVASRWFLGSSKDDKGYLGLCGLAEDALTFHGLRHSFINQFRRQKLDMLIGKSHTLHHVPDAVRPQHLKFRSCLSWLVNRSITARRNRLGQSPQAEIGCGHHVSRESGAIQSAAEEGPTCANRLIKTTATTNTS